MRPRAPDWRVAIASHDRADTLAAKTLAFLARHGVPAALVDVFVAGPELSAYRRRLDPASYGQLLEGAPGMAGNRNAATAHYRPGDHVLFLDDDVEELLVLSRPGRELAPWTGDLSAFIGKAFLAISDLGLSLWGVYPVPNPFYMARRANVGLVFCVGSMFGSRIVRGPAGQVTVDAKEDYERTLLRWEADGAVLRFDYLCPQTRYYKEPGGLQNTRTVAAAEAEVAYLERRFPGLVHRNPRRTSDFPEILLRLPGAER